MKKIINPFDYAGTIAKYMKKGILLTTKGENFVNTMTIGWGTIGLEWGLPVFVAYVRDSRYTRSLLDKNMEFTVNCPIDDIDSKIISVCGTKSGRDMNKIEALNLHTEEPLNGNVPGIRELPLTLECRVVYRNEQPTDGIPQEILDRFYPVKDGKRDYHIAYYGEIIGAYLIED